MSARVIYTKTSMCVKEMVGGLAWLDEDRLIIAKPFCDEGCHLLAIQVNLSFYRCTFCYLI